MMKILIQNQTCETVINNIEPEDMDFWRGVLNEALLRGEVQIVDSDSEGHYAA